jgi:hypothetical protein
VLPVGDRRSSVSSVGQRARWSTSSEGTQTAITGGDHQHCTHPSDDHPGGRRC